MDRLSRPLALATVTIAVLAAAPAATGLTYGSDDQHRLRSVSSASEMATLAYDRAGRLVAITGADGGVTSFAYDAVGKLSAWLPEVGARWSWPSCRTTRASRTSGCSGRRHVPTAVASRSR